MNWNTKPTSDMMPQLPSKSQSSFLQQALINPLASASHGSLNYSGSKQESCMYPSQPNTLAQPLISLKNYATSQQISISDMHDGTSMASQTSVETKPSSNVKGHKQLNHSLQLSTGTVQNTWLHSPMKNSKLSHTRTTVDSNQISFGANPSTIHIVQNQFVSSDTYSMQLQMIPSNSGRGPVTCQGNQGPNPSLTERCIDWAQQLTSNGMTFPDYRSPQKQYCNSQQRSRGHILQKQNPMLSELLHVKNTPVSNSTHFLQSQQNPPAQSQQYAISQIGDRLPPPGYNYKYVPGQSPQNVVLPSQQYAVPQVDSRPPPSYGYKYGPMQAQQHAAVSPQENIPVQSQNVPVQLQYVVSQIDNRGPPPNYDCKYTSLPLQNTQLLSKHSPKEIPQNHDTHLNEKDYRGDFQQWQNPNKEVNTIGKFCNLQVNQSVNKPMRSLVNGVQTASQHNQDKSVVSGNSASTQVLDTNVTKEVIASDIKTLMEIKRNFLELARKIKINKELLMAAGCSKACNASHGELAENSELPMKQTSKIQSRPQVTHVIAKFSEGQLTRVMKCTGEINRTHSTLNTEIQEIDGKKLNQDKSILLNSDCLEKLPVTGQFGDSQALKTSTVEFTQTFNDSQFPSENVKGDQNVSANAEAVPVPQLVLLKERVPIPTDKKAVLQFLLFRDKAKDAARKKASETTQDPKPNHLEVNPNTQVISEPPNLKTTETQNTYHVRTKDSDKSFCVDQESSTNGGSKSDCSMELIATCLSLWKKTPSESAKEKHCNELRTNRTTGDTCKPADLYVENPCVVVENAQNSTMLINSEQQETLPVVVQTYEPSGTNVTKGSELQVAVVSPLILSDVKTMSVKAVTPEALPETLYPVIKEGSVCSLQDQSAENINVITTLKADANQPNTAPSTKISLLIQKEEQDKPTICNSGVLNTNQEKHIKSTSNVYSSSSEDTSIFSRVSGNQQMSSDMLQIANICSLVEGDRSFNSQIAEIFNSPSLNKVQPQKPCLPDEQVMSCVQQKEKLDNAIENKNFGFQKENIVQFTDGSSKPKITTDTHLPFSEPSSLKSVEVNGEILEANKLEYIANKNTITNTCSADTRQAVPETDTPYSYTAQDPANSAVPNDKTSILYLHDQLSELLKEFPYGIEPVNSRDSPMGQQVEDDILTNDQSCDKAGCDSPNSTDQIKITIISSEQMKELFSEQEDQPSDGDNLAKLTKLQNENPSTKVGSKCAPKEETHEGSHSVVPNDHKDDIHCCALGWLSLIYEGVPQCQCKSNNSASKEEKNSQCSPLEISKCEQGNKDSDRNLTVEGNNPPSKDQKVSVTPPGGQKGNRTSDGDITAECNGSPTEDHKMSQTLSDGKNLVSEIKQDNNIKDKSKANHNSVKTDRAKCDKKLDPLHSHKRKRELQFHEITFHSNSKMPKIGEQDPSESIQKHQAQNPCPPKAKTGNLTDHKNGSLMQSKSPEKKKLKFKAGSSKYKLMDKRKPEYGTPVDKERQKKKHDQGEQNKDTRTSFNPKPLSHSKDRASIKEKTVSIEVKPTNGEANIHRSLTKSSNSDIKPSESQDASCKIKKRVLTPKEYLERQKHKEAVSHKATKDSIIEKVKTVPEDSRPSKHEDVRPNKHHTRGESLGKSNERGSSLVQTSESLNLPTSHGKPLKMHHPEESKMPKSSKVIEGKDGRLQHDKTCTVKSKTDKHLASLNSESHMAKDQGKRYLNRVAFKCTEHESISLSKLDNSPKKPNTERRQENDTKNVLPVKPSITKPPMLEFKLWPDTILGNKIDEERKTLKPSPKKEQAPIQVSGMKSTKEAWLKCVNSEKRMLDANQRDNNILPKSKLPKRSISADGPETVQNTVKDSTGMFQTFKRMHMEKKNAGNGLST
ncbi:retroelement silencing factor 1 [Tenrec ecaudatus]|uniref:retroelement silencing factor 1 n=1 Tax=Tenrec ecaudatus TaxID=94439 RepID=UPI003F5A8490